MKAILILLAAIQLSWGEPPECMHFSSGRTLRLQVSSSRSPCFAITVESGEPAQLIIDQPVDLAFHIGEGAAETITDGFEFGSETLTMVAPGQYRVRVHPLDAARTDVSYFSLSRRAVPLAKAEVTRQAELSATAAKRVQTQESIAAALLAWERVNNDSAVARTYLEQGDVSLALEDFVKARTAYEDGWRTCRLVGDLRCLAEAANNSGYASFRLGDFEAARNRLEEAAAHWRALILPLYEGRTLNNLGLLFLQSGNFTEAIATLNKARRLLDNRDPIVHAQVLNNLGLCYQSLGENEQALAHFQSTLAVFHARHEQAVRARYNLGRSYMLMGKLELAKSIFDLALDEAVRVSNTPARADVLMNLGQLLQTLHRDEDARHSLEEALALQRQVHSKRGEAVALHYLGIDAGRRGEPAAARQLLTDAARIRRDSGLRDEASESLFALAELEYQAGDAAAARDFALQAIQTVESLRGAVPNAFLRAAYYARKRRFFDLLVAIDMRPADGNPANAFLASEQSHGRALLDLLTGTGTAHSVPKTLLYRGAGLRREINLLAVRLTDPDPAGQKPAAAHNLEQKRDGLRRRIQLLLTEDEQVD